MRRTWLLTAVGRDRPGIVAGVTSMLYELGCNLEDSAMTRLGGEFAMMLVFSASKPLETAQLNRACQPLAKRLRLIVHLKVLTAAEQRSSTRGRPYLISVYGADRPGIVYQVSSTLACLGINITDVSTHRTGGPADARRSRARGRQPLYLMVLEIELPARVTPRRLETTLHHLAKRLGVDVAIRSTEAPVL